jgi:hypothetical protein
MLRAVEPEADHLAGLGELAGGPGEVLSDASRAHPCCPDARAEGTVRQRAGAQHRPRVSARDPLQAPVDSQWSKTVRLPGFVHSAQQRQL